IVAEGETSSQFTVAGDFSLASGATLEMLLSSTSQHSRLAVEGGLSLAGGLVVELDLGYQPAVGDAFDLLDFDTLSGGFELASLPLLDWGMKWDTSALLT